jgi:hypothetical protein
MEMEKNTMRKKTIKEGDFWICRSRSQELPYSSMWLFRVVFSTEFEGEKYYLCVKYDFKTKKPAIDFDNPSANAPQAYWFDCEGEEVNLCFSSTLKFYFYRKSQAKIK